MNTKSTNNEERIFQLFSIVSLPSSLFRSSWCSIQASSAKREKTKKNWNEKCMEIQNTKKNQKSNTRCNSLEYLVWRSTSREGRQIGALQQFQRQRQECRQFDIRIYFAFPHLFFSTLLQRVRPACCQSQIPCVLLLLLLWMSRGGEKGIN